MIIRAASYSCYYLPATFFLRLSGRRRRRIRDERSSVPWMDADDQTGRRTESDKRSVYVVSFMVFNACTRVRAQYGRQSAGSN